jgi:hypothetical protein
MRYSTTTTADVATIINQARERFGPNGAGLRMTNVGMTEVSFASDIGHVNVTVERSDGLNEVIIETRELDTEAQAFLRSLPRESFLGQFLRRRRSKASPSTTP